MQCRVPEPKAGGNLCVTPNFPKSSFLDSSPEFSAFLRGDKPVYASFLRPVPGWLPGYRRVAAVYLPVNCCLLSLASESHFHKFVIVDNSDIARDIAHC